MSTLIVCVSPAVPAKESGLVVVTVPSDGEKTGNAESHSKGAIDCAGESDGEHHCCRARPGSFHDRWVVDG